MTEAIATFRKTPSERKRYRVDYTDWLDTAETISSVVFVNDDDITIDGWLVATDGLSVTFFVSDGDDGETYKVIVRATTSGNQIEDTCLLFVVEDY